MEALAALFAGSAVFLFLAYAIRARAMRPSEARIRFLSPRDEVKHDSVQAGALLRRAPASTPALGRFLNRNGRAERWTDELERAELKLRPSEYLLMRLMLGAFALLIIAGFGRSTPAFIIGLIAGAMVFQLPAFWVRFRIKRRVEKINAQLVETITMISGALRSGFAFSQGLDVAAKRIGPPMSTELNRMLLDVNLGASTEAALSTMNDRIGSDDVDVVVTAILIQRNTGGNLAEVLDSVTETMRDRERIQGEIKTLTSQQRLTGWILSLWPTALAGIFFLVNPSIMSLMWTTSAGLVLLVIWIILNLLGIFTIRRVLDIDI